MKRIARIAIVSTLALTLPSLALAACDSGKFCNFTNFPDIQTFVANALKALVMVAIPVIGFFIVVVGFKFVAAQGNAGKLAEARKNFLYVVIGAGLVLGAWVLATLIGATVSQLTG